MNQIMDDESRAFIADLEQRRGGSITYRTFSTFYADSLGKVCDYGVFLYVVDNTFWFQDFEHVPSFLGFRLPVKNAEEYQMFESSFKASDVMAIRKVKKKATRKCALGYMDLSKLRKFNPVLGILSESATELRLKDGRVLFFQFMDRTVENMIRQSKDINIDNKGE